MTVKELIKLLSELPDNPLEICMYSDPEGNDLAPVADEICTEVDDDGNEFYVLSPLY